MTQQVDIAKVSGNNITKKKYHIDTTALHFPKKGMEVSTYLKDGMIEDWDMFEQVPSLWCAHKLKHIFIENLYSSLIHPRSIFLYFTIAFDNNFKKYLG